MISAALLAAVLIASGDEGEPGSQPRALATRQACADNEIAYFGIRASSRVPLGKKSPPADNKARVVHVEPGSPAAEADLGIGEQIVAIDGTPIETADQLEAIIAARCPDQRILVETLGPEGLREISIVLTRGPGKVALKPRYTQIPRKSRGTLLEKSPPQKTGTTWYGWQTLL